MYKKIFRAIIIALFCFNACVTSVYAEPKIKEYYSIDLNSLNVNVKQYLTSLSIDKQTKEVFINNTFVGVQTNDTQSFSLPTTNYTLNVTITLSTLSVDANVNVKTQKIYKSAFKFEIEENTYYVCYFYPDYENSSLNQKIVANRDGETYYFNTFKYNYGNDYKEFNVKLIHSSGDIYVNGEKIGTLSNINIPIVFEYIGSDFPITNIDYMHGKLAQFSWNVAKQEKYPFYNRETDFANISIQQNYEYTNKYLSLPSVSVANGPYIDEYIRVGGSSTTGTGSWQSTGNKTWVVCEYYENEKCGNAIRQEFPRYWAVYSSELDKTLPVVKYNTNLNDYITEYKNYYYPDDMWKSINNYEETSGGAVVQFRSRVSYWTSWTSWVKYDFKTYDDCEASSNCKSEFKYEYTDWTAELNKHGSYQSQCESEWHHDDQKCGGPIIYSDYGEWKTRAYSTGVCNKKNGAYSECGIKNYSYSDYGSYQSYSYGMGNCNTKTERNSKCGTESKSCTRYFCATSRTCKKSLAGICIGGYTYSGYKYTYGSKPSPAYDCDSQQVTSSNCGTQNKQCTLYSCAQKRTPNYNSCDLFSCAQKQEWQSCYFYRCPNTRTTFYRYMYNQWTNWTDWKLATNDEIYSSVNQYQFRKNDGTYRWEDKRGTNTQGSSTIGWFSGKSSDKREIEKLVNVDIANQSSVAKQYANKDLYTLSDVETFQSEYAKDKIGSSYLDELMNSSEARGTTTKFVTWDIFNNGVINSTLYPKALSDIKNEEIYSPYLYFYGWRFFTSNANVPSGTAQKTISANEYINYSSSGLLIENSEPIERDTKIIYFDYHDPLTNYKDKYPENWQGYETLVNEIENSDLSNYKISVKISESDIQAMKDYLNNGGYQKVGTCDMLRAFSYIFIDLDNEMLSWLSSGSTCKIGE